MKKVAPDNLLHAVLLLLLLVAVLKAHGSSGNSNWMNSRPSDVPVIHILHTNLHESARNSADETALAVDQNGLDRIMNETPNQIDLRIDGGTGKEFTVQLTRVRVHTDDFNLGLIGNNSSIVNYERGLHYRGSLKGKTGSLASFSFMNGGIHGMIILEDDQWEIAPTEDENGSHGLRKSSSSGSMNDFSCGTLTAPGNIKSESPYQTEGVACKTVNVSIECDFKMYKDFQQNAVATADYISALMNQVATLYQHENIAIQLQEIKVWSSTDPYSNINTAGELLTALRVTKGSDFNGDLCHFLTTRNIGGGMAYLNVLCNKEYAHGTSSVLTSFNNAPSYSWSVEVLTHELGHNFGSNHTHWCGWQRSDGTTGALDNCYTSEGGCASGPSPQNGGTIMSYCHLTSHGISFSKGFGVEPGNLIRERLTNANCIQSGGPTPIGMNTASITNTTARIGWSPVPGSDSYTAEYRIAGATTWTNLGTTSSTFLQLNQLSAGTSYEWHVKTGCSSYSSSCYFTTVSPTSCSTPTGLTLSFISGISARLNWQAVIGCSRYQLQYRKSGTNTWTTVDNIQSTNHLLTGLTGTTTYNWRVKAECSSFSGISNFTTSSSGCPVPNTTVTTNITSTGAKLTWSNTAGATNYVLSYKDQRESRWRSMSLPGSTMNLTGLNPGTTYEWKVRSNCSNTSSTNTFQTTNSLPMYITMSEEALKVYPNPATSRIRIETTTTDDFGTATTAILTDAIGKVKNNLTFESNSFDLDISNLDDGIYLLQVFDNEGKSRSQRFMKR